MLLKIIDLFCKRALYKRVYILEMVIYIYAAEAIVPRVFRHETMGENGRGTWRGKHCGEKNTALCKAYI